ncbi:microtubule binding protein [Papiliotrema laurentii]|uniref:Coronin n=1 Tax=Papiliotrema laurentii TaxID=5418 RepID=A0AAD9FM44_PAPLA|nr:microtubule binding protein [Papiliotrema laurentii]
MSRFVRASKYRHVYGEKSKTAYENAKISGSAWDTNLVTAGGKYIAVNWQVAGGGAFAILPEYSPFTPPAPAGFPTKLPDILPLARGHTAPVLDTAWSPFDDNLVTSAGEDGKIYIWRVEDSLFEGWGEDGWKPEDLSPVGKLNAGGRKVGQVVFHPTASNLLTSASGDHLVRLWDIEHGQDAPQITLKGHGDSIQSIAWNPVGNQLATTCRDKKLRLFDPRAGAEAVRIADGHSGVKGSRVVWLGDRDRIATTGFSKMSDRQVGLWDTSSLTSLELNSLDSSAGVLMPFFAEGNDILFLAGKGDGNIRYFEYEGDSLHFLNEYKSSDPQRGFNLLPRRALDVGQNEIARGYKLAGGSIEALSFIVPRKAESFQSDIFPPANSIEPALSSSDWFGGKDARPKVVDLETRSVSSSSAPIPAAPTKSASTPAPAPAASTPTPVRSETAPTKSEPAPASLTTAPSTATETKPLAPPSPVAEPKAKDLEIQQPESDDEPEPAPSSAPEAPKSANVSIVSTPAPNGSSVTAPKDHLLIKRLSDKATLPTRGSPLSAGYDLYAAEETVVPKRGKALVDLQISVACPEGTYGRIAPRSGLAAKHSIDTGAGVIDADYRGPVKVLLFNFSDEEFTVKHGDRVAQLILERIVMAPLLEVDDLEATARGAGGFGSTGGFGKTA